MKRLEVVRSVEIPKSDLVKSGNNYAIANTQVCNEISFAIDELLDYIGDQNIKLTNSVCQCKYNRRYNISVRGEFEE